VKVYRHRTAFKNVEVEIEYKDASCRTERTMKEGSKRVIKLIVVILRLTRPIYRNVLYSYTKQPLEMIGVVGRNSYRSLRIHIATC
jgi:hypothetical protein